MNIKTSHLSNKNKEIIIRDAQASDLEPLTECIKTYLQSGFVPFTVEEFNPSLEERTKWMNQFMQSDTSLLLVAECEGKIVGNIDIASHHRSMLRHTSYLGMGVHANWQGQGIGSMLLDRAIEWCEAQVETEILWLQVFGNNEAAIHLYLKRGFKEEGRQKKFIKTPDGYYIDNVIMTRDCRQ